MIDKNKPIQIEHITGWEDAECLYIDDKILLYKIDSETYLWKNYDLRYLRNKPEKKYRPFIWEERNQIRGKWIVHKDDNNEQQIRSLGLYDGIFYINDIKVDKYLENYLFLDTKLPFGVLTND